MRKNKARRVLLVVVGIAMAGFGCSPDDGRPASAGEAGTVQVALTASTPAGTTYRIGHGVFDVFNRAGACSSSPCASVSGDDPMVTVDLPPSVVSGDYTMYLEDGWTISRLAADGTETPVAATLLANAIDFTIKPRRTTPLTFQFEIDGEVAATGDGTAAVTPDFLELLIDDFEDGDDQVARIGGRNGQWVTFNDGSGIETPPAGAPVLPEVLDTSANEWLHVTGSGFGQAGLPLPDGTYSYGAGVAANLVVDPATGRTQPYNASPYTGIGFTVVAKFPADAQPLLTFFVQTSATMPVAEGGTCLAGCNDGFTTKIPLWPTPYGSIFSGVIPWEALHQLGFGACAVFDRTTIMSLNWLVSFPNLGQALSSNVFDLALDDITFAPGGFAVPPSGPAVSACPSPGGPPGPKGPPGPVGP